MKIKIVLIAVSIIAVVVAGVFLAGKFVFRSALVKAAPAVSLKANGLSESITVPYNASTTLTWTSKNVRRCSASGDWFGALAISGAESIENITESRTYTLTCVNDKNEWASSAVTINVDEKDRPLEQKPGLSAKELFKDFFYRWQKYLYLGMKDDPDVIALQTVLFLEGFFSSSDQITGAFDDLTFEAVKKFQEAYGIEPTGFVGPKTVAKLNELYGASELAYSPEPSLPSTTSPPATPPQIFGAELDINYYAQTVATINLRDDNCREIGTVPANTLLKIISSAKKFCLIGGKSFQMRQVQIVSTGQVGWLAAVFLKKTEAPVISSLTLIPTTATTSTTPTTPTTPIPTSAPSVEVTVDLKANNRSSITVFKNSSVALSWISENANSCNAYGGWSGNKSPVGSELISNLTKSTYYALTCSGDAGSDSDSVNVFVSAIIPDSGDTLTPDTLTPEAGAFGGLVTNVSPCTNPLRNNSIQLLSPKEGKLARYIWKMGESQLQNVLGEEGEYVPFGIPEVGMWLLGELGEEVECYGAGGPGKLIKWTGYGF